MSSSDGWRSAGKNDCERLRAFVGVPSRAKFDMRGAKAQIRSHPAKRIPHEQV